MCASTIGRGLGPQVTWTSCPEQATVRTHGLGLRTFQYLLYTLREHGWFNLHFYTGDIVGLRLGRSVSCSPRIPSKKSQKSLDKWDKSGKSETFRSRPNVFVSTLGKDNIY